MATEFGTTWLQESYKADLSKITLFDQANSLKQKVKGSTVGFFGDESLLSYPVGAFQGTVSYSPPEPPAPDVPSFVNFFKGNSTVAGDF